MPTKQILIKKAKPPSIPFLSPAVCNSATFPTSTTHVHRHYHHLHHQNSSIISTLPSSTHSFSLQFVEISMEISTKRKRLDARSFRQWHIAEARKNKDSKLKEGSNDQLEVNCSKESDSKKQRIDSEAKPHAGSGEAIPGELEDFELASMSTNTLLHEKTHGEMLEDGVLGDVGAKKRPQGLSDCKTKFPRYVEYWVPVGLSYVQLEKCCETLQKNSMLLCSNQKRVHDGLIDILSTIRKCCDHPYLVDSSLRGFVNEVHPIGNCFRNDIEVSGKILLLHKLLQEVKEKQLRVLIVFQNLLQSNNSKQQVVNLQHILDDLICANVGEDCYIQLYREFDSIKKRAAVDLFNDRESGKLVMLIEKSSCQPSIKLSSVDCVILFNSDWCPINDIKCLQKMLIESKFDHLKVFRLYSSRSVEEKALILAKKGAALESNSNHFSQNTNHMLLLYGTSYLFSKLDELHSQCSSTSDLSHLSEDKLVIDVLNELSALLSCPENDNMSCSLISKVRDANDDCFRNIALHGEQDESVREDDIPPMAIWTSLLEGRNPQWKLLPRSSERIRRRVESKNEDPRTLSKKTSHIQNKLFDSKPEVQKVCGSSPDKIAGHQKSCGSALKLSSCRDDYSLSETENTCDRSMRDLMLKQKNEIREFYRTKREERAKLEEEHQLEVDNMNKNYRETVLKLEKLKTLDIIYEQKLKKHSHQMEIKKKELEDEHSASRMKEKQRIDNMLKTKNLETPTTSRVKLPLLDTALEQQTVNLNENAVDSAILMSNTASVSESKHSHEIELGTMNASAQCHDPGCPDLVLTDTDILSGKSNEENDAASMRTEEVSDTEKPNDLIPFPANNRASTSSSLWDNECQATLQASKRDVEGNSSTNMESSKEIIHCMTPMLPVSVSLESDGENDVAVVPSGEVLDTCVEVLNCGNLCTSEEAQLNTSSGNSCAESLSNFPRTAIQEPDCNVEAFGATNREAEIGGASDLGPSLPVTWRQRIEQVQDEHCNSEAVVGVSNEQAEIRGPVDSDTNGTVVEQQRVEEAQDEDCNIKISVGAPNGEAEVRSAAELGTTAPVAWTQKIKELQGEHCNTEAAVAVSNEEAEMRGATDSSANVTIAEQKRGKEVQDENCNIKTSVGAPNGEADMSDAADLVTTATMGVQQAIEELTELPPSRLNCGSQLFVQPQTCSGIGNPSELEQPMLYANLPYNEIRQSAGASAVSNCQTSRVLAPCQPGQTQITLRNLGLCDHPVVQTQWQSTAGQEQPQFSNSGTSANMQSANSYLQGSPSLRYNLLPSSFDPLQNELVRMKKEEEEAVKIHENETIHLKSACKKEMQEIQKKYDLLLREADNKLVWKKLDLESHYKKVYAHKLLADTLKYTNQKQTSTSMSQEALLSTVLQFGPLQFNLPSQRPFGVTGEPTAPPIQVVHQLSELVSFDATRPQNCSTLYNTGNPLAGYHARSSAPHLRPPRPVNSHGSSLQHHGTQQNPLLL
ncbi:uncharacterized protein [Spinacia oleracea]|uniref:Uncharacterized protein isoform X3 n=1 Tax=Spinacia oleracea TaxID=3562 RepID=A0A9R0IWP5_SPIOL|nr:uncharacterized protein LOC110796049 isoform X3 [Spinacia oleracea]